MHLQFAWCFGDGGYERTGNRWKVSMQKKFRKRWLWECVFMSGYEITERMGG